LEAIKIEAVLRFEERLKKWDALNVIPVVVRYEYVRVDARLGLRIAPAVVHHAQVIAQHAQPGAAIEDETHAIGTRNFHARRVTAVAPRISIRRRRGTADAPENQLGFCLRHAWAEITRA
jgi:hypothetical protein